MKIQGWFITLALFAFSCNQAADAPPVKVDVYTRYEQEGKKLKAEAIFLEENAAGGGKSLTFQGGVGFLGSGMLSRNLPGGIVRYEFERVMDLPENLSFHFTDEQGKTQNADLKIPHVRDFALLAEPLSRKGAFSLLVEGPPLMPEEKLVLIFSDANNQSLTLEGSSAAPSQEITFGPGMLSKLAPGPVQVFLVRKSIANKSQGRYSYRIETEFYTLGKTVELGE